MVTTRTIWKEDHLFESEHEGNRIAVDGDKKKGHGPKALLLSGLAGCSGIDVVDILTKMRVEFSDLSIIAQAEQAEDHPKVFRDILITYKIRIDPENEDKLKKAIDLSLDKYCGVAAMLKKNAGINYKIEIVK